MKKSVLLAILVVLSASLFSCGGGGSSTSVTVALSPVNGATYKLLGTAVTAAFSSAITAPSDWSTIFTLKKNNTGDNLCTSVTLSADALTATCVHDELDFASSYTVALTGLTGVTDPTPATFQTSNIFGGYNASNGALVRIAIDQPSAGKMAIWAPLYWPTEQISDYTIDPADPTLYTISPSNTQARIAGNFAAVMTGSNGVAFCLLIDPNQTNMNFRTGTNYGGQGLQRNSGNDFVLMYYTDTSDSAGTEVIESNVDISLSPAGPFTTPLSAYTFNTTDFDLLLTQTPIELLSYINVDGYSISRVNYNGLFANLLIGNEDRVNDNIPSDVAVGDIYNGYLYIIPEILKTLQLTVTSVNATSVTFSYILNGTDEGSLSFTNITSPASWGTGFYRTSSDEVIRFLGPNAILFTVNNLTNDFNFGVLVK